jgi:hypothetical protein
MQRDRRPYIILPLAAFIAILPLIVRGCSCGHDFDFHLINWFEAVRQLTHGTLHPHWAFSPAWNAGEPRFVFYPPLSWLIGALLGILMPWTWTPIAYTWLALTAAGIGLFHAARSFSTPNAALLAAAIYIVNPYTLYTAYERTAYAELLAATWIPLLLNVILRERVTIPRIAIPVALLWLTNAPAAVMSCYAFALLALIRLIVPAEPGAPSSARDGKAGARLRWASRASATAPGHLESSNRSHLALVTIAGTALGLGLAAFYIIPAAYQRRYVQIAFAILPGLSPQENFLFHHTADPEHDAVLRTASMVAVLLTALTAITLSIALKAEHKFQLTNTPGAPSSGRDGAADTRRRWASRASATASAQLILPLALLTLVIAFLLTPLSAPIWIHLPQLRFLQFPWRLTAILAAVFALALSVALSHLPLNSTRTICISLLIAPVLSAPAYKAFHQRCYTEDTVPTRLAIFRSANPGSEPTDEYTPIGADNESLDDSNPGYWLAASPNTPAPAHATPGPSPHHLDLNPTAPQILILNLRDYPAWQLRINNSPVTARLHRRDGLIAIPLPAGPAHLDITYATLPDQRLGYLISLISAAVLILVLLRDNHARSSGNPHRTTDLSST